MLLRDGPVIISGLHQFLSSGIPLYTVHREICCRDLQVAEAAYEMLSVMDEEAAAANNKIDLFISEERFPEVFEARQGVADADAGLVRAPCLLPSS